MLQKRSFRIMPICWQSLREDIERLARKPISGSRRTSDAIFNRTEVSATIDESHLLISSSSVSSQMSVHLEKKSREICGAKCRRKRHWWRRFWRNWLQIRWWRHLEWLQFMLCCLNLSQIFRNLGVKIIKRCHPVGDRVWDLDKKSGDLPPPTPFLDLSGIPEIGS